MLPRPGVAASLARRIALQQGGNGMAKVTGAHLIGSVPLPDAETVFRTVARELGAHLARIPDGETGNRGRWIWWQREMLLRHPAMEPDTDTPAFVLRQWDGAVIRTTDWLRFRPGVDPATVAFDTGYADAARESYAVFRGLRDAGDLPAAMRFQVCLPTPMASGYVARGRIFVHTGGGLALAGTRRAPAAVRDSGHRRGDRPAAGVVGQPRHP